MPVLRNKQILLMPLFVIQGKSECDSAHEAADEAHFFIRRFSFSVLEVRQGKGDG